MEKSTLDEYSSINNFYDQLVDDRELFEIKVLEMEDEQVIEMYKYLSFKLSGKNITDNLFYAVRYLEELDSVRLYLNGGYSDGDILLEEDQKEIDEMIKLLEKRRKPSLVNRFVNYFKN